MLLLLIQMPHICTYTKVLIQFKITSQDTKCNFQTCFKRLVLQIIEENVRMGNYRVCGAPIHYSMSIKYGAVRSTTTTTTTTTSTTWKQVLVLHIILYSFFFLIIIMYI